MAIYHPTKTWLKNYRKGSKLEPEPPLMTVFSYRTESGEAKTVDKSTNERAETTEGFDRPTRKERT